MSLVVVGASLAGVQSAKVLRREGYEGPLVVVGEETHVPYDRPPLSKSYLTDETVDEERLALRAAAGAEAVEVDWMLGTRAVGLDRDRSVVVLDDGRELPFDGLVVATGARPRRLPGQDEAPEGVQELRTLDDARALRARIEAGAARVAVCGAGFIGAEVAASARSRGLEVTLIDRVETPLDRVLDRQAGAAVADLHRSHGVELRLGVGVAGFEPGPDGRVRAVALDDGSTVEADLVVVGIGVVPNTEWLDGSGLAVDDGLVADETTLVAPGIVAAGDVARWPNPRYGTSMRVEQWENAVDMGSHAARRLLAEPDLSTGDEPTPEPVPYAPIPWFWSDQYDRKIQLAGVVTDRHEVVQGSLAEQRFVQIYGDDAGRLLGALCWNRPRQAVLARQMMGDGATLDDARDRLA